MSAKWEGYNNEQFTQIRGEKYLERYWKKKMELSESGLRN